MSSVLEYIPLLQAFVDHNSTTEAVEEEFEAAVSVPTVFYNKEKMGKPTDGEILLLALLLLARYSGRQLCEWINATLEQKARYEEQGSAWGAPPGGWRPTQQLAAAFLGVEKSTWAACARVLYLEGLVAVEPEGDHLRSGYIAKCTKKPPELQGPMTINGKANKRHVVAMVPVAILLNDVATRARLLKLFNEAEEWRPNAGKMTKPELQTNNSSLRVEVKEERSGKRKAEHAVEWLAAQATSTAEALEAERKRQKSERLEAVKKVVDAWKERQKKKRRDKAAQIRAGEQRKATARVQGQLTNASRLRNEANAKKRTAEDALAYHKKLAEDRLQKLKDSDHELSAAKAKIDEYREVLSVTPAIKPVAVSKYRVGRVSIE